MHELRLDLGFFDGLFACDEQQSQLVAVVLVYIDHELLEGSRLVMTHEEAVHGKVGQIDQVEGLAVAEDQDWEGAEVEVRQRDEVSTLRLVREWARDLDQGLLHFVNEGYPRHTPAAYCELVGRHFIDLCHKVVSKQEVFLQCEYFLDWVQLSEVQATRAGQSEIVLGCPNDLVDTARHFVLRDLHHLVVLDLNRCQLTSLLSTDYRELVRRANGEDVPADVQLPENSKVVIEVNQEQLAVRANQ